MRKLLLLLVVALFMPLLSSAANNAITKAFYSTNAMASYASINEGMVVVNRDQAGIATDVKMQTNDASQFSIGFWFKTDAVYTANQNISWAIPFAFGTTKYMGMTDAITISHHLNGNLVFHHTSSAKVLDSSVTGYEAAFSGNATKVEAFEQGTGQLGNVPLGEWCYMLMVFDNKNRDFRIYVDGEQRYQVSGQRMGSVETDAVFKFIGHGFNGSLDEVQIFTKALTEAEAKQAYFGAQGMDGLSALYTFDDTSVANTYPNEAEGGNSSFNAFYNYNKYTNYGTYLYSSTSHTVGVGTATYGEGRALGGDDINVTISTTPAEGGQLTLTNGDNVFGASADAQTLKTKTLYDVNATPAEGYNLVRIEKTENGETTTIDNGSSIVFEGDATVNAVFTNRKVALTIDNEGQIPYSVYRGTQDITDQIGSLTPGWKYSILPQPAEDMIVLGVKLNGEDLEVDGTGAYNFEMPDDDATITIVSRARFVYTITIVKPEGGVVKAIKGTSTQIASGTTVYEGTKLSLANTPEAGYKFVNYTVNGENITGSVITIDGNSTISGLFEVGVDYCEPTYSPNAAAAGQKSSSSNTGRYVTKLNFSDGETSLDVDGRGATSNRMVYYDQSEKVFSTEAGRTITITTSGGGSWMNTYIYLDKDRNGLTTDDLMFSNFDTEEHTIAGTYTIELPKDLPTGNYRLRYIVDWCNNDPCFYRDKPSGGNAQGDNGDAVIDVTFHIEAQKVDARTITVETEGEQYGTVAIIGSNEKSVTSTNPEVTVVATATDKNAFMCWVDQDGNVLSTKSVFAYTGTTDVVLTAKFGHLVTIPAMAEGTVTVTNDKGEELADGTVVERGTKLTLTATPGADYRFRTILVNNISVDGNPVEIEVNENVVISASFFEGANTLTINSTGGGQAKVYTDMSDDEEPAGAQLQNGDYFGMGSDLIIYLMPDEGCEVVSANAYDDSDEEGTYIYFDPENWEDDGMFWQPMYAEGMESGQIYISMLGDLRGNAIITAVFTTPSTAIDGINADNSNAPAEVYNLQGVRVNSTNLTPGIYIVRQGSKTRKVLVSGK